MNSRPILIGYSGGLFNKSNGVGADRAQNNWQFVRIKSHSYLKFARSTISIAGAILSVSCSGEIVVHGVNRQPIAM